MHSRVRDKKNVASALRHCSCNYAGCFREAAIGSPSARLFDSEEPPLNVPGNIASADIPTFVESGYKELVATTWFSLSGPAGIPSEISRKLNLAVRDALAAPELRERLAAEGIEPNDLDPGGFTRFVRDEVARWGPIARAAR